MLNTYQKKLKSKNININCIDSNFLRVNAIVNQRLIGLVDYLKASIYFSRYNDKKNKKISRNLENFFKNKIFKANPFSSASLKSSQNSYSSEKKNSNEPLDVVINIKNNKLTFQKNKYSTPYELHSKKHNFFKNMVDFSKYIHSKFKIEQDLEKKYPRIESIPLISSFNKKSNLLKQKFSRTALSIKIDGSTSTYYDKSSFIKNKYKNGKYKIKSAETFLSFDNKIDRYRKNFEIQKNNYIINSNNNSNNLFPNKDVIKRINSTHKDFKLFKPNCYYNCLHLKKLSKNLKKYTYLNKDDN